MAAQRTNLHAPFLDLFVQLLHQLLTALLIECRDVQTNDGTVVTGRQSEIGGEDGLLDRLDETPVPRLDDDLSRLGGADRRQRNERGRRAVGIDLELFDEARSGTSGADARQLMAERVDRLLHP